MCDEAFFLKKNLKIRVFIFIYNFYFENLIYK